MAVTTANVTGSSGCTPNRNVAIDRLRAADSARPIERAGDNHARGAAEDQAQDVAAARAERDADAELAAALLDRIRQDAEHADHRHQERQPREGCHHHRPEAIACR